MTRADILKDYIVDAKGIIRSLGKFEGEMLYVPYFWDKGLLGEYSADIANVYFFEVDNEDRAQFPELGADVYGIALEESDTGFVYTTHFSDETLYSAAVERMEALEQEQDEE